MSESLELLDEQVATAVPSPERDQASPETPPKPEVFLFDGWTLEPLALPERH